MKQVLVIAPHPDDDIIGCGGSIIKHIANGSKVHIAYCTDTTDIDCAHMSCSEYYNKRIAEIQDAAAALGLQKSNYTILSHAPWKFDAEKLRFDFLKVIRDVKPNILYIPHQEDGHIDHQIASIAAQYAATMAPSPWFRVFGDTDSCPPIDVVLAYEVWTPLQKPIYFEDISKEQLEKAIGALQEHRHTQETYKYGPAMQGRAMYRGAMHEGELGSSFAEAFQILSVRSGYLTIAGKKTRRIKTDSIL